MRAGNLWHRTCYVFIEMPDGKFLVQKRVATKEYCPSYYALATGGVQAPDESAELNAMREVQEEVGVTRSTSDMKLIGEFSYKDDKTQVWGSVFYLKLNSNDTITKQIEEVEAVEYWTKAELEDLIKNQGSSDKKITPDGIAAWDVIKKNAKVVK